MYISSEWTYIAVIMHLGSIWTLLSFCIQCDLNYLNPFSPAWVKYYPGLINSRRMPKYFVNILGSHWCTNVEASNNTVLSIIAKTNTLLPVMLSRSIPAQSSYMCTRILIDCGWNACVENGLDLLNKKQLHSTQTMQWSIKLYTWTPSLFIPMHVPPFQL